MIIRFILTSLILCLFISCEEQHDYSQRVYIKAIHGSVSIAGDSFVFSGWDSTVGLYDLQEMKLVKKIKIMEEFVKQPIIHKNNIYFAHSNKELACFNLVNNKYTWITDVSEKIRNIKLINDSLLAISITLKGIGVVNMKSGKLLYTLGFSYFNKPSRSTVPPNPDFWDIVCDDTSFYVSFWGNSLISKFRNFDGKLLWAFDKHENGVIGKPVLVGDKIFVGLNDGYVSGCIYLLGASNGELLFSKSIKIEEFMPPIVNGKDVIFYTFDNRIYNFNSDSYKLSIIKQLHPDSSISGSVWSVYDRRICMNIRMFQPIYYHLDSNKFEVMKKLFYSPHFYKLKERRWYYFY